MRHGLCHHQRFGLSFGGNATVVEKIRSEVEMLLEGQFGRLEDGECRHLLEKVARFGIRRAREGSGTRATGIRGSFCLVFFLALVSTLPKSRETRPGSRDSVRKKVRGSERNGEPKRLEEPAQESIKKSNEDGFREGEGAPKRPQLPMGKPSGESNCRRNPMRRLTAQISCPIVLPGKRTDGDGNVVDLDRLSSAKKKPFGEVR